MDRGCTTDRFGKSAEHVHSSSPKANLIQFGGNNLSIQVRGQGKEGHATDRFGKSAEHVYSSSSLGVTLIN